MACILDSKDEEKGMDRNQKDDELEKYTGRGRVWRGLPRRSDFTRR